MAQDKLQNAFTALRAGDRSAFISAIDTFDSSAGDFERANRHPYADWFNGIGATLLQMTAFLKPDFARVLVDRGAQLDLHTACALGDVQSVQHMLQEQPDAIRHQVDTFYPIQFALGQPNVLRLLLESGDDANRPIEKVAWFDWEEQAAERNIAEWRPIHMVALGRGDQPHLEAAEVLREFGANLNAIAMPLGVQPIHLSATYDRVQLIRWFIANGVDVDATTAETPHKDEIAELFDVKPFAPLHSHGQTPLMVALGEGMEDAVDALLELGANINAKDAAGFTPLHYAAGAYWDENTYNVRKLLDRGASLNRGPEGLRSTDLAEAKGYAATLRLLQEHT